MLRTAGLRATRPRTRILDVLRTTTVPLSVLDIAAKVERAIDTVTIYRTLESLLKAGLVSRIELQKGRAYYELSDRHHHHHVVCRSCGRIEDVEGCELESLERDIARKSKHFRNIDSHALEFFGECSRCAK